MTNDMPVTEIDLEAMPAALLAELFSSGIVVIPEEFETSAPKPEKPLPMVNAGQEAQTVSQEERLVEKHQVQEVPVADNLSWLGSFGKRVLVVVKDPTALHINEADFDLLGKIMGSVKLSMADVAVVNAATHKLEYYALNEKLPASVAFYFGIQPVEIGAPIKCPQFQVQPWNNTTFVYAPPLGELNGATPQATALKKELWTALKKIFG
jgi:hypothetical protein